MTIFVFIEEIFPSKFFSSKFDSFQPGRFVWKMFFFWKFLRNLGIFCRLTFEIKFQKQFLIYDSCLIDDWSLSGVNLASRDGEERVSDWHLGWYLLVTNF